MFLRHTKRWKDGKVHYYWSLVENRRCSGKRVVQHTLLYLGEINDSQKEQWIRAIEVFDEDRGEAEQLKLFAAGRPMPENAVGGVQVQLRDFELHRPRQWGGCWLFSEVWQGLGLEGFWRPRLGISREGTNWEHVLQTLCCYRLLDPGSEWRLHRTWFDQSAMCDLLGEDFSVAAKDTLYRCLDRVLEHKEELFGFLRGRWEDLFGVKFDVLLYDLTSTYFESDPPFAENDKRKFGYSRDKRSDCVQVVIALIVTPEGFPLAYEVLPGNTADKTTLRGFLKKIETQYGKARRIWIMDRGIPTEEALAEMRASDPPVLARSRDRVAKERAMRRRQLKKLWARLADLKRQAPARDALLLKLGAAKSQSPSAWRLVDIEVSKEGALTYWLRKDKLREVTRREGRYLLRSNLKADDPAEIWKLYMLLTQVEESFKNLKGDLAVRPIYHQCEKRIEAHIFVAFLAFCLHATLRHKLRQKAPGLTPRSLIEQLCAIPMLDVHFPTTDGRTLVFPRYTNPNKTQKLLIAQLGLQLPPQPPPRISSAKTLAPLPA